METSWTCRSTLPTAGWTGGQGNPEPTWYQCGRFGDRRGGFGNRGGFGDRFDDRGRNGGGGFGAGRDRDREGGFGRDREGGFGAPREREGGFGNRDREERS